MRRAASLLVSILIAASTLVATAPPASAAYFGKVWSNLNAFSVACIGVNDQYPTRMYNLAIAQLKKLDFDPVNGALGAGFTRTEFLSTVQAAYAVYVHSHGDNYWAASGPPNIDSGFLQDPGVGRCSNTNRDMVRSSAVKTATKGTQYNLVIMSTCYLGSSKSTMPGAFQIEMTKSSSAPEFYLGYVNSTYDSSAYRFESAFWSYMNGSTPHSRTFYQAFTYATSIGGYAIPDDNSPFVANWWGNPAYDGTPRAR
jgi:hypothetical protein